ncbi:MAG: hypothetical protein R3310_09345, partial [Candidatus Competibacteraceae bacterium]|nr:hypothetical protein [Candidatus Competibacteraceae bacterium]
MDTRLPGIVFQAQPRQPQAVLPRMDIAALVGFSASGPVNLPVPVEDAGRYRELFGPDLTLAWDEERGETVSSRLGGAVEAFFRQGGQRCWVVRVAEPDTPVRRFPLTGLVAAGTPRVDPTQSPWIATQARSPGTWAATLTVEPLLERQKLSSQGFDFDGDGYRLELISPPPALRPGDLLEITLGPGQPVLWLFVDTLQRQARTTRVTGREGYWYQALESSPDQQEGRVLTLLSEEEGRMAAGSPAPPAAVQLLHLEIRIQQGGTDWRLGGLAFRQDHPRYWAHLPDDGELFALHQGRRPPELSAQRRALHREADSPRFPLAGPPGAPGSCLPLTMTISPTGARGPLPAPGDNGNGPERFEAGLFLDRRLAGVGSGALLGEAEGLYYLRQQALEGLYSLLPVEEITLIGVPDAGHLPWDRRPPAPGEYLPAPELDPLPAHPDDLGRYRLDWAAVAGATSYQLQQDSSPEFTAPTTVIVEPRQSDLADDLHAPPPSEAQITLTGDCPRPRYFRVRARRYGDLSPWSGTRGRILPVEDFDSCQVPPIVELQLRQQPADSPAADQLRLDWQPGDGRVPAGLDYELQQGADGAFIAVLEQTIGPATTALVSQPLDGTRFYRVRAHHPQGPGPWSNTLVVRPRARSNFTLLPQSDYRGEQMLAIHRALMRFCAARGDLLACLSLPRHFRRRQVEDYLDTLLPGGAGTTTAGVPVLTPGEAWVLSYAALYHPWPAWQPQSSGAPAVAFAPADGFILGQMAGLALEQGAWLAPANRPLTGVIALDPELDAQDRQALTAAQVNLLQQDPRGFLVLNAETLAPDGEYRPLQVRRLLIPLRRLALREGRSYVFEPHDRDF